MGTLGIVVVVMAGVCFGAAGGEIVVDLEEVSAFEAGEHVNAFLIGQNADLLEKPDPEVKAYPKLVSESALYGYVEFGRKSGKEDSGVKYCFVFDQSGGTGTSVDRLYFDANRDLDLTNDPMLRPQTPPASVNVVSAGEQ